MGSILCIRATISSASELEVFTSSSSVITQTNLHAFSMGISAGFFIFCLKTLLESANCLCHWEGAAGLFLSKKVLNITSDAGDTFALLFQRFPTK